MTTWKTYRLKDVTSILGDGLHGTPVYDENGEWSLYLSIREDVAKRYYNGNWVELQISVK